MYTLGYSFRPWTQREGDRRRAGDSRIRAGHRARRTASTQHIRFGHRVQARCVVVAGRALDGRSRARAATRAGALHVQLPVHVQRLLQLRRGLYAGVPGHRALRGPHRASAEVDGGHRLRDKRVVVIGSGATAVTLVPEMAKTAAHVTMLQRSPTYVISRPAEDFDRERSAARAAGEARVRLSRAGRTCCSA